MRRLKHLKRSENTKTCSKADEAKKIVLGVDIGTTNIRCYAYNKSAEVIGGAIEQMPILEYDDGRHEIQPEVLWDAFQSVVKHCLINSGVEAKDISGMGISTQRASFLTWNRLSSEPFHNFITWKDRRSEKLCEDWNSSLFLKAIRFIAWLMYLTTRRKIFQVASVLKFKSSMVLSRLYWVIHNNIKVQENILKKQLLFGTIGTWLVWKLTGGEVHATDTSNACVTGFFDIFKMEWISWLLRYYNIPIDILPTVKNTSDFFGKTLPEIFGSSILISSVVGDQQASLFGSTCFKENEINCTMGTGTFLNMNTGFSPKSSINGIYPLVAWTICSQTTFMVESCIHDVGAILTLAKNIGAFEDLSISSSIAQGESGSDLFFLPKATLLEIAASFPMNCSVIIGLQFNTTKEQIVRSILEALSYQVFLLWEHMKCYNVKQAKILRLSGGISNNHFVVQNVSSLINKPVTRMFNYETSSMGAALLAGLRCGVWKDTEEILALKKEFDIIHPIASVKNESYMQYKKWKKALFTGIF